MSTHVAFNEDVFDEFSHARPEPNTFAKRLVLAHLARTKEDATLLLSLLIIGLFFILFSLLAQVVPETPSLGVDVLRPGEVVPDYIK